MKLKVIFILFYVADCEMLLLQAMQILAYAL